MTIGVRGFPSQLVIPIGHPEHREGSLHAYLVPQPRSPRLHLVAFAVRLLDPSLHGLFALLTSRFAQDDRLWIVRFAHNPFLSG